MSTDCLAAWQTAMRLPAQQMRPVQTHSNTHIDTHTCNCTNQLPQINHPPSPLLATHSSHSVSLLGSICKENIYVKFILLEWHTREHCVCRLCVFITALVCLCLFYNDYRMTFANMFWRKWKRTDIGVKKLETASINLYVFFVCVSFCGRLNWHFSWGSFLQLRGPLQDQQTHRHLPICVSRSHFFTVSHCSRPFSLIALAEGSVLTWLCMGLQPISYTLIAFPITFASPAWSCGQEKHSWQMCFNRNL